MSYPAVCYVNNFPFFVKKKYFERFPFKMHQIFIKDLAEGYNVSSVNAFSLTFLLYRCKIYTVILHFLFYIRPHNCYYVVTGFPI